MLHLLLPLVSARGQAADGSMGPDLSTHGSRRPALDYRRSSSLGFGLVVPVHPPKMSELCNLVHSNVPFSIPLWAVLSRREHASLLRCHVDWFVIPEFVGNLSQAERSHKNTNIPTKKKCWMAIKYVFDNFPSMPTLVALDAESTVLRPLAMRDVHEFEIDMAIVTYGVQPATRLFGEINARSCRAVHLPPIRHAAYMWWRGAHLPSPRFRRLLPAHRLGCIAEPAQSCVRSHLIPVLPIPRARLEAGSREFVARAAALPHTRRAPPAHVAAAPANTVRSRDPLLAFHVDRFACNGEKNTSGPPAAPGSASAPAHNKSNWCSASWIDLPTPAPAPGSSPPKAPLSVRSVVRGFRPARGVAAKANFTN